MSDKKEESKSAADSHTPHSSATPNSEPSSPAFTSAKPASTTTPSKAASSNPATPSPSSSSSSTTAAAKPSSTSKPEKRDSGGGLSSLKASLEKAVPKVASITSDSSSSSASSAPTPSSSSGSSTDWTSRLTFGLASSKAKADLSDWLPDTTDKVPLSLFAQPPPDAKPLLSTPPDPRFPNFTSVLPPPPPPSSALRYGWIDEYGDYHPQPSSSQPGKLNPKLLKAKEQAKELISAILHAQERLEKDKDPSSPRMSAVVKEKLHIDSHGKDAHSQGVDRLVQVVEGAKGEKKVVVTEEEHVQVDI